MAAEQEQPVEGAPVFSGYQRLIIAILAFLQFTLILDFMIISPLGAIVMEKLQITPSQFGWAVSAYAFSAAMSGVLAAGFADRFDRKRLLLFFYGGFILGTLLCALATSFATLMAARIVTGLFGGVIGSVVLAIATDLFPLEKRGRVMGFIQTAFGAAQVLGLPAGIYLANLWDWHFPFIAIVAIAVPASILIMVKMRPVAAHLGLPQEHSAWRHLGHTLLDPRHSAAFATTAFLATGGYMLMPFGSAYIVHNIGIPLARLPTIYLATGFCTVFAGPVIGKAADRLGKFRTFVFGTLATTVMVAIWTHLPPVPILVVITVNVLIFFGIFARMIPAQALISAIPDKAHRGAFNAVSASLQQFSGGIASVIAGAIIFQDDSGHLHRFDWLGYGVILSALIGLALMRQIHRAVPEAIAPSPKPAE